MSREDYRDLEDDEDLLDDEEDDDDEDGERSDRGRGDRRTDGVPAIIRRRRPFGRRKVCRFCVDPSLPIDFRDPQLLKYFVTERGKIIPRRISGNCARHQRRIARAIKRARVLGLMPFTVVTS